MTSWKCHSCQPPFGCRQARVASIVSFHLAVVSASRCPPQDVIRYAAMTPLDRITTRVNREGDVNDSATPRPMLTLEEFFEGNQAVGSVCCNCTPTPEPFVVYQMLKDIRSRKDVVDVRIQVTMFDDPESWRYSDTDWVITTASADDVKEWFEQSMAPDECTEGWDGTERESVEVPDAFHPVWCWWD